MDVLLLRKGGTHMTNRLRMRIAATRKTLSIAILAASVFVTHGCAVTDDDSSSDSEDLQDTSPSSNPEEVSSESNVGDKALRRDWCCALKMEGVFEDEIVVGCLGYGKRTRIVAEAQCWSAHREDQGLSSTTLRSGGCSQYPDCR
jgi:hypothetical protein